MVGGRPELLSSDKAGVPGHWSLRYGVLSRRTARRNRLNV